MSQFRPFPSFQAVHTPDLTKEQLEEVPFTPSASATTTKTSPLLLFSSQQSARTTEPLASTLDTAGSFTLPLVSRRSTDTLLSSALPVTSTTGRIVRIPGSRKRQATTRVTEDLPRPKSAIKPHLRQGIVISTILLMICTSLIFLTPLDNGQGGFGLFRNISNWVQAEQANWQFQSQLAQIVQNNPSQSTSLPVAPPPVNLPKSAYVAIAQQDAINAGISPDYFTRQINLESGYNPNAYSPSGAEGIAQFMPATAAGLGLNPWDPIASLNAAAHYMASYNRNYGGNYAMALAAYNGGSGTVQYAINTCGSSNWMNCLPGETRNYIRVIMGI